MSGRSQRPALEPIRVTTHAKRSAGVPSIMMSASS
jgi:hypothetical protein